MSALLEVHRKYSTMVSLSFGDDAGFMQALDKVKVYYAVYTTCGNE